MYAYIKDYKIKNIHAGSNKPNIPDVEKFNVLPIEESTPNYDVDSQYLEEKPRSEWEILDDKVLITYNIIDKNIDEETFEYREKLIGIREHYIHSGINVNINGVNYPVMTSEKALSRLDQAALDAERRPDNWVKKWKFADGTRLEVGYDEIELMRAKVSDHVEQCFENEETLESQINSSNTFSELNEIDLYSGWPKILN